MPVNFTEAANRAMAIANKEAQRLNREAIEPEHVLMGLLRAHGGLALSVLRNLAVDVEKVYAELEELLDKGAHAVDRGQLPETAQTKKLIEYTAQKVGHRGRSHVGTEQILLALLSEREGIAARVLMNQGLTQENVTEQIRKLVAGGARDTTADMARILEGQRTIDLYIDPGNASAETIKEVLVALSDLHVAAGGLGLEFVDDSHFIYATARAER